MSLDWDDRMLRVVSAVPQQARLRNVRAAWVALPAELNRADPAAMGQFIRASLDAQGISGQRAVVDVPRDQAILNTLTLPAGPEAELPAAVHFQIVKELPFALDQAVVDFAVSGRNPQQGTVDVLVAAVRNDVLAHYRQVIEHAGLKLQRVGLRPYANLVAIRHRWPETQEGRVLLVDVGPSLTEIDVVRDGRLVFSRAASARVPSQTGQERQGPGASGANPVADLLLEVTRSLEAYRVTDPGAAMTRIVVAGATGIEAALAEGLQKRFACPTSLYEPGEGLIGVDSPEASRGFSAAAGLAIGHSQAGLLEFDFLHPKTPIDRAAVRARQMRLGALAAAVAITAVGVGVHHYLGAKRARLSALRTEIAQLEPKVKEFNDFRKQVEIAANWARGETIWLEHLRRLTELFPDSKEAYATAVNMSGSGSIDVPLRMAETNVSNQLARRLQEAGYRAVPGAATVRDTTDRYPVSGGLRVWAPEPGTKVAKGPSPTTQPSGPGEEPELASAAGPPPDPSAAVQSLGAQTGRATSAAVGSAAQPSRQRTGEK